MAASFHFARKEKREEKGGKEGGREEKRDWWMDTEASARRVPLSAWDGRRREDGEWWGDVGSEEGWDREVDEGGEKQEGAEIMGRRADKAQEGSGKSAES